MQSNSFTFNDALASHSPSSASIKSSKEIFLKVVLVLVAFIFVIEFVWLVLISPSMPLASVEINGIPEIERDYILNHVGITNDTTFFSVNTSIMEKALEKLFMVESAQVIKQFPNKIYIKLNPRIPVALSLGFVNGKSTPLFIDKHGVICKIGLSDSESKVQANNLPIISGLIFDNVSLGMRLPISLRNMLEDIEKISLNNPILLSSISEIRIQKKIYDGFEMILYLTNSNVKVRIGSMLNEDIIKNIILILDVLKETNVELDELDFRTGIASYKIKEALNG